MKPAANEALLTERLNPKHLRLSDPLWRERLNSETPNVSL